MQRTEFDLPQNRHDGSEPTLSQHVVLIGASARAAAESAARAGFAVTSIDAFGDVDTRRASQRWLRLGAGPGLLQQCASLPPGPVILTGGMESWLDSLEPLRAIRPVLAPPTELVRTIRSPHFLHQLAENAGLEFPPWRPDMPPDPRGWLQKRTDSSGGCHVTFCRDPDAVASNRNPEGPVPESEPTTYFQRWMDGRTWSAAFVGTSDGARLIGTCRSLTERMGDRPFLYAGSCGPLPVRSAVLERIQRAADSLCRRCGLRGLFGVDFLVRPHTNKPVLLEVNPRATASMELYERSGAPSLVAAHIAAHRTGALSNEPDIDPVPTAGVTPPQVFVKRICWSRTGHIWRTPASLPSRVTLHDVPQEGTPIAPGQPMVTLIARGTTPGEAARRARTEMRALGQPPRS